MKMFPFIKIHAPNFHWMNETTISLIGPLGMETKHLLFNYTYEKHLETTLGRGKKIKK